MNTPNTPTIDLSLPTTELLQLLAERRIQHAEAKDTMKAILERAKTDPTYMMAEFNASNAEEAIADLEKTIKARALEEYEKSSNKNPFNGVKVKIFKIFKVLNEDSLHEWIRENFKAAIKTVYDMKLVEDFAKKNTVPGTEVREEPRVEIASKLP